jgi:hypothetical protein
MLYCFKFFRKVIVGDNLWFSLPTPELELRLRLEELSKVRIHEEIIPELLEELSNAINSDGEVKHPVIVDSNTLVVLDGMHRVAALEKLGCKYLPVCLVDYQSPSVKVGCWYRTVDGRAGVDKLLDILQTLGLTPKESPLEHTMEKLAIQSKEKCYLVKGAGEGVRENSALVRRIDEALRKRGLKVDYETESDAVQKIQSGEITAVILTPKVTKEEVIEAARSGKVFPHKTTRHVVAARPMGINVPLKWLKGEKPLDEVNRMLIEHLSKRKVKRLPKGALFEGRRYEEELWIFE